MIDLAEFDTTPVERDTFLVDNDSKADWAIRKLASIRAKIAENERLAVAERERIDQWLQRVNAAFGDDIAYFEGQLRQYAEKQRAEGRKSVDLPHGKIKSRAVAAKFDVVDKELFLKWAREHAPNLIRTTEAPAISAMNEVITKTSDGIPVVTETGEVVVGVAITDPTVSYTFETE